MKIKQEIIDLLAGDLEARFKIATKTNHSMVSVDRWIRLNNNNSPLTHYTALLSISETTGLSIHDLIEDQEPIISRRIL